MTEKQRNILMMLQNGKSYTDIQAKLNVYPSAIAVVKKKYMTTTNTTTTKSIANDSDAFDDTLDITGAHNVKDYMRRLGIKITLKALKKLNISGSGLTVENLSKIFTIKRLNKKKWQVKAI